MAHFFAITTLHLQSTTLHDCTSWTNHGIINWFWIKMLINISNFCLSFSFTLGFTVLAGLVIGWDHCKGWVIDWSLQEVWWLAGVNKRLSKWFWPVALHCIIPVTYPPHARIVIIISQCLDSRLNNKGPVWDKYLDIQIYLNIFRWIYSFVYIFVDFFQDEFIQIFICDLFIKTNIIRYSFVQYLW